MSNAGKQLDEVNNKPLEHWRVDMMSQHTARMLRSGEWMEIEILKEHFAEYARAFRDGEVIELPTGVYKIVGCWSKKFWADSRRITIIIARINQNKWKQIETTRIES